MCKSPFSKKAESFEVKRYKLNTFVSLGRLCFLANPTSRGPWENDFLQEHCLSEFNQDSIYKEERENVD